MKTKIEDRIKAVKDAVAKDDTAEIKAATEALQKEMMDMGAAMYQSAGAAGSSGPAGDAAGSSGSSSSSSGKGDDTIDAEFTDAK